MTGTVIRPIRREDFAAWLPLWQGYLTFYEAHLDDAVTPVLWERFFDPAEPIHALVAERDGILIGVTHYLFHRNTWMLNPVCYLQDLFTAAAARGQGTGRALIEAVAAEAEKAGSARLYWMTHETNTTARSLYDKAAERSGFIQYRRSFVS